MIEREFVSPEAGVHQIGEAFNRGHISQDGFLFLLYPIFLNFFYCLETIICSGWSLYMLNLNLDIYFSFFYSQHMVVVDFKTLFFNSRCPKPVVFCAKSAMSLLGLHQVILVTIILDQNGQLSISFIIIIINSEGETFNQICHADMAYLNSQ